MIRNPEQIADIRQDLLDRSYEFCYQTMATNSKSFTFASQYLDEEQKRSVAALYAYCRFTDDIVDEVWLPDQIKADKLDTLQSQIENIEHIDFTGNPILIALCDTVMKYKIPKEYLIELIEGVRMDLEINEFENTDQLDLYCYRVASIVGIMMCYIFGVTSEIALSRAADLGKGMQITNILRDISRDFEMGRIYLPRNLREQYGVTINDLVLKNESEGLIELIKHESSRAKKFYERGKEGIMYLPEGADFTVKVASAVYSEILNEIKRMDYKVLTRRAVVSKPRKIWIALKLKFRRFYYKSPMGIFHNNGVELS